MFNLVPAEIITIFLRLDATEYSADTANQKAVEALSALTKIAEGLQTLATMPRAEPQELPDDLMPSVDQGSEDDDLTPREELGTIAAQNADAVEISGGSIGADLTDDTDQLVKSSTTLADGAGAGAGTLTNAPTAGDPSKWIEVDDNGTTLYIPAWT